MKRIRSIIVVLLLIAAPVLSFTQPLPYQNGNGTSIGNIPVGGPIDGGLGFLLAMGLGYGLNKVIILKKQKKTE
jgi:hypothetical protein